MSMDGAVTPNLVARSLDVQCKVGFYDFVDDIFPNIYYSYSGRVEVPWFDFARREHDSGKALEWCFRSLGAFQAGRATGNQRQILASREMYGRGLLHLVQGIKHPATASMDVTLAAAILLGVYELVNSTNEESWLLHSRGISHLFRLRGPQSHARGFGRTLLLSFRGLLVFEAFARGEACFLGDEEWRAILPSIIEDEERRGRVSRMTQLVDYAFNEIAQCPGFLVMAKSLVASPTTTNAERENLIGVLGISLDTLRGLESQMILGIQADRERDDKGARSFFASIPSSNQDALAKYSMEGVRSAIELLQQLLAVLVSDAARRTASTSWSTLDPMKTEWVVIKNADVIKRMAHKKIRLHLTVGPQPQGSPMVWPDRILLAMGMPEKG